MDLAALEKKHPPSFDPCWQESWYFNFSDPGNNVYGLTRIGYRPSKNKADGLLLASINGKPALLYPALGKRLGSGRVTIDPPDMLQVDNLCFTCRSIMDTWQLSLKTRRVDLDLAWATMTGPYLYPEVATDTGRSAAADHYEQAGRVTGHIRFGNTDINVNGWGQRDHSWGPRHWSGVGDWTWISAQFESGWAFNHWHLGAGPPAKTCGFVGDAAGNRDLIKADIDWQGDAQGRKPSGARLELSMADGEKRDMSFTAKTMWPLYKDGAIITETFGVFSCRGENGVGVVERLFVPRLGPLSLMPYVPKMAGMALYSR